MDFKSHLSFILIMVNIYATQLQQAKLYVLFQYLCLKHIISRYITMVIPSVHVLCKLRISSILINNLFLSMLFCISWRKTLSADLLNTVVGAVSTRMFVCVRTKYFLHLQTEGVILLCFNQYSLWFVLRSGASVTKCYCTNTNC